MSFLRNEATNSQYNHTKHRHRPCSPASAFSRELITRRESENRRNHAQLAKPITPQNRGGDAKYKIGATRQSSVHCEIESQTENTIQDFISQSFSTSNNYTTLRKEQPPDTHNLGLSVNFESNTIQEKDIIKELVKDNYLSEENQKIKKLAKVSINRNIKVQPEPLKTCKKETNMVIATENNRMSQTLGGMSRTLGKTVRCALNRAQFEKRIVVGLSAAVSNLSKAPDDYLLCVMAAPNAGDSGTHIQEVLLEAFCYENDIYIVKVDDADKLSRILGSSRKEACALVKKSWLNDHMEALSADEEVLVDHCEKYWDAAVQPIVRLPEM